MQLDGRVISGSSRRRSKKPILLLVLAVLLVAGFVGATQYIRANAAGESALKSAPAAQPRSQQPGALTDLPPPDLLRPLTAQEALATNAERPIVARADDASAAFTMNADAINKGRAIDCLTQAIYYEAASEGLDGGRAVAQIVLNRVRHSGYPNSVCGVVYEGSTRATGCQFSFTCDESLARIPVAYLWGRSRVLATEALAGRVFAPVGHATHYHADYVVPYWADSLDKVAVIGRHIFYRLRGASGSKPAFSQRYASFEPTPLAPLSTEVIEQGLDAIAQDSPTGLLPYLPKVEEDLVKALDNAPKAVTQAKEPLAADVTRGQLILGESRPSAKSESRTTTPEQCDAVRENRSKPMGAADLKASLAKKAC